MLYDDASHQTFSADKQLSPDMRARSLFRSICATILPTALCMRPDEKYSFSLTTFDPSGKLGQVERANEAAANGVPIIAFLRPSSISLASPRINPSPLIEDDGTSRFARISSEIFMAFTGISADGRVVLKAAQMLAIEHQYTFDSEIRIDQFLEELSLLFQEYTIKAGARPFGCTAVVAHLDKANGKTALFQIDSSGSITKAEELVFIVNNGEFSRTSLLSQLRELGNEDMDTRSSTDRVAAILLQVISERSKKAIGDNVNTYGCSIETASMCHNSGYATRCFTESPDQPPTLKE